ncbi:MAG: fused MFS/spermidine synthase [Thermodesulfobacteriota bacterium]
MAAYALTIFLSAFLLFQVQPLMGRYILPWFGGTPAVWTTCMLFFQLLLLAGYLYAHLINRYLAQRKQVFFHIGLIATAMLLLPIAPGTGYKPAGGDDPVVRILFILTTSIGLPYFLLAATGPLLQAWYRLLFPGTSPYRLYALSNAGSLLALLSYPFVVEPALRLRIQSLLWSAGLGVFGVFCAVCALKTWKIQSRPTPDISPAEAAAVGGIPRPSPLAASLWLALAACGSVMLLAVTNQICADIAVVPFLWILPLSLYLLTFILCFENDRFYYRPVFWTLLTMAAGAFLWMLDKGVDLSIRTQVLGYSAGLFVCCMVCHGELVRLKPQPRYLTLFYLMISAGGALGGLFVTLVSPRIFTSYAELHVGLWSCCALALAAFLYELRIGRRRLLKWQAAAYAVLSLAVLGVFGEALRLSARQTHADTVSLSRNFYGILRVSVNYPRSPESMNYSLEHGRISHGCQFVSEDRRRQATTYYSDRSGVGLALLNMPRKSGLRVGIVGLGTGTIAAYGNKSDRFTFYEINPAVIDIATRRFTYLSDSQAVCDIVLGDARVSLERQPPQDFDILVLDAFNSDAIPVHLLTLESFETYLRHLKKGGVIAVHITNRYLDLAPVMETLADHFKFAAALIDSESEPDEEIDAATWMLLSRSSAFLSQEDILDATTPGNPGARRRILWTDDFSNLFQILK